MPPWLRLALRYCPASRALLEMEPVARLALEMAVVEGLERRALAGEAAALAGRWQQAEEIAAIADNLLIPSRITAWLKRHRRDERSSSLPTDERIA